MKKTVQLKFNDLAPNLELLTLEGTPVQLANFWREKPLLLAFTRHFGCPQCKELLDELEQHHQEINANGVAVLAILNAEPTLAKEFAAQRAPNLLCLADPTRAAYQAYGLGRGSLKQTLLTPRIWQSNADLQKRKGFKSELPAKGQDAFQMGGVFIIGTDGRIRLPYYYDNIADHPALELLQKGVMGMDWEKPFNSPIGND